ncbi:MAG: tail fiber domain-containing protein [Verrucomicrobiota bacterium]|jgi:hypothetical protein
MKIKLYYPFIVFTLLALAALNTGLSTASAQGTAFTYQGHLNDGASPANGLYDFRFKLALDEVGTNYVGGPFLTNSITVTNGLFVTTVDFGAGIFNGSNYWLEVDVRTNNPANTLAYTTLAPLQGIAPTPYAIFAITASNVSGTVSAAQLSGPIPPGQLSGTYLDAVNFDNTGNTFSGQFSGNGGGLTNLNAWGLTGNSSTTPGVNFAGTTDNNAFEIHVDDARVLRLEPDPRGLGAGNVIGGHLANAILQPGSGGDVIAGGGVSGGGNVINANSTGAFIGAGVGNQTGPDVADSVIGGGNGNVVQTNANWSTIGGGQHNTVGSSGGTIAGGQYNVASGTNSAIAGGYGNVATANFATVPGGNQNAAAGVDSFAAGNDAVAESPGEFVWADSLNYVFDPDAQSGPQGIENSFNVRSTGGFYIVTGVDTSGNITAGTFLNADATSWSTLSDRNAKKDFSPVDYQAVLDKLASVPIESWHYKWEKDSDVPNLGPMAQDFKHAFYPGRDDKSITTLEFDGVELAAIQGLNQKLNDKDVEIQELKAKADKVDQLEKQLNELEAIVNQLAAQK